MRYFANINLLRGFLSRFVYNNKKTKEYFFHSLQDKIYLKNSVKEYHATDEVISELKQCGLLHEIIEYKGIIDTDSKSLGYILDYSSLMRFISREDEPLSNDINMYKMLTINQACDLLNLSRPTVYKLLRTDELKHVEILGQKRIQLKDLLNFIQEKTSK